MNQQNFLEKFSEQLEGYSGEPITMDTFFRDIDVWDSLTGVAVQIMIKDELGSAIPDSDFIASKSIRDLYEIALKYKV
jgi:acyl carrier protein